MPTKLKYRKRKLIKVKPQTAKAGVSESADRARKALKCGVRISRTGKQYTETRANRCDEDLRKRI